MSNDIEVLRQRIQEVNNKIIKLQTISDQAKSRCVEIETKYNIKNEQELQQLVDKVEADYQNKVSEALNYLSDAESALLPYEALL